jgi:hypothetical protein
MTDPSNVDCVFERKFSKSPIFFPKKKNSKIRNLIHSESLFVICYNFLLIFLFFPDAWTSVGHCNVEGWFSGLLDWRGPRNCKVRNPIQAVRQALPGSESGP